MNTLYVYFKVQARHASVLKIAILGMQANLRSAMPGLATSLHQRTHNHPMHVFIAPPHAGPFLPETTTWMEIYHFNYPADSKTWQQLMQFLRQATLELPMGIDGERQVEWFAPITAVEK